ncbi:MAG: hypothetical protein DWQ06_03405 [Calditrichaeota bacterium]|nr:MAG: hypothetical protein DWQ06_03405 [Calditrichota bacterium]
MEENYEELLEKLENVPKESIERVDILVELAWRSWSKDFDITQTYTFEALELSKKLNYDKGKIYSIRNLAGMHFYKAENEKAIQKFEEVLDWCKVNNDKDLEATVLNAIATMYWGIGDFEKGFEYAFRFLKISEELGSIRGKSFACLTLGNFYHDKKDYDESLIYYQKTYELAISLERQQDLLSAKARALNGIGIIHLYRNEFETALDYTKQSLEIHSEINSEIGVSRSYDDIGRIYFAMGDLEKAIEFHMKSLELREKIGYIQGKTTTFLGLGKVLTKQGKLDEAIKHISQALELAEMTKTKVKISDSYKYFAEAYSLKGDFEKALEFYQKYHILELEINNERTDTRVKGLKTTFEIEKSKKESEIYKLKNTILKEKNEALEQAIQKLNATQAQLLQTGKMTALGKLVAGVAHELNTPIGIIKSSIDNLTKGVSKLKGLNLEAENESSSKQLTRTLKVIEQSNENVNSSTERVIKIVNSLKTFASLDKAELQKINIHDGIESTLTLIGQEMQKGVEVEKDFADLPEIYCYPSQLNQVFMNLILNAIKSVNGNGKVGIKTASKNGSVYVSISDSGKGIPQEKLEHLFEPGFTFNDSRVRMRTGLYTSFNIINQHKGNLSVASELNKGTTFMIELPKELKLKN